MSYKPPLGVIQEALKHPNGYVYAIDQEYDGKEEIPPTAIKGAWKVNEKGVIIGDFIPNPNYIIKKLI